MTTILSIDFSPAVRPESGLAALSAFGGDPDGAGAHELSALADWTARPASDAFRPIEQQPSSVSPSSAADWAVAVSGLPADSSVRTPAAPAAATGETAIVAPTLALGETAATAPVAAPGPTPVEPDAASSVPSAVSAEQLAFAAVCRALGDACESLIRNFGGQPALAATDAMTRPVPVAAEPLAAATPAVQEPSVSDLLVPMTTVQAPVVSTPAAQAAEVQASVAQMPAAQELIAQTPTVSTSSVQAPAVQTSEVQVAEVQASVVQMPAVQELIAQTPTEPASSVQAPEVQAPVAQAAEVQAPLAPTITGQTSSVPTAAVPMPDESTRQLLPVESEAKSAPVESTPKPMASASATPQREAETEQDSTIDIAALPNPVGVPPAGATLSPEVSAAGILPPAVVRLAGEVAMRMEVAADRLNSGFQVDFELRPEILDGSRVSVEVADGHLTVRIEAATTELAGWLERMAPQFAGQLGLRLSGYAIAVEVRRRDRRVGEAET